MPYRQIEVAVTQEHIDTGQPKHCNGCPVFLALKPMIAEGIRGEVSSGALWFIDDDGEEDITCFNLPPTASNFIRAFDAGVHVEPFSFVMHIEEEYLKPKEGTP